MNARSVGVLLSLSLVISACANGDGAPEGGGGSDLGPMIGEDGVVPLDLALLEFVAAFGPLPGVQGDGRPGSQSGSGPLRWIRNHWDALTEDQRRAVEDYTTAGTVAEAAPPSFVAAGSGPVALGSGGVDGLALLQLATQIEQQIVNRMGRPLGIDIEIRVAPTLVLGTALAFVTTRDATGGWGGIPVVCEITITKSGMDIAAGFAMGDAPGDELLHVMAHEVFHCFQDTAGGLPASATVGWVAWVIEGMAEWAALEFASGATGLWEYENQGWLTNPTLSLFQRSYTAVGFWAHVQEHGTSVWSIADEITLLSVNSDNAYNAVLAASGGGAELLATWGAAYFRDPTAAPAWDMEGNGIPDIDTAPKFVLSVAAGEAAGFDVAPRGAAAYRASLTAQVVTLVGDGEGMLRLPDGSEMTIGGGIREVLCTDPAGCSCADGTPGAYAIFRQASTGEMRVGVTGHRTGTDLVARGWDLDTFCEEHKPWSLSCLAGTWMSASYHAPGQQTIGGVGIRLAVDDEGNAEVVYTEAATIVARVEDGGHAAPWVRMEQTGSSRFTLAIIGPGTAAVTSAASTAYTMTPYVFLDGGWVQTVEPINLAGTFMGTGVRFTCDGSELMMGDPGGLAWYVFARTGWSSGPVPPVAGGDPGDPGSGDPGGGTDLTAPPGWGNQVDPCELLTLDEVRTLAASAEPPGTSDVILTPTLLQCAFPLGMVVQMIAPQSQEQFLSGYAGFDLEVTQLPGLGDWAVVLHTLPDPQFGGDGVFLVAAAGSGGVVSLTPWNNVDRDSAEQAQLIQLLGIALSRS